MFPHFTLSRAGQFELEQSLLGDPGLTPAQQIQTPDFPSAPRFWDHLQHSVELAAALVVISTIVSHLRSRVACAPRCGLILDGPAAQEIGRAAARALGCAELDLAARGSRIPALERVRQAAGRHDWPLLVQLPPRLSRSLPMPWIEEPAVRNTILPLDPIAAIAAASGGGFVRLEVPGTPQPFPPQLSSLPTLLFEYLADLFRRDMVLPRVEGPSVAAVLEDLLAYLGREEPVSWVSAKARSFLKIDSHPVWRPFLLLLQRLLACGDLTWSLAETPRRSPRSADVQVAQATSGSRVTTIRIARLQQALLNRRLCGLPFEVILVALSRAGATPSDGVVEHEGQWRLRSSWLDGQMEWPWQPQDSHRFQWTATDSNRDGIELIANGAVAGKSHACALASVVGSPATGRANVVLGVKLEELY